MAIAETERAPLVGHASGKVTVEVGIVAGIIGGMLMAALTMMATAASGMGLLAPLKLIAATFFGKEATAGGAGVLLVGLMLHMMNAAVLGVIFAALIRRIEGGGAAVVAGLAFGIAVWLATTFIALPVADPIMRAAVATIPGVWFVAHMFFGVGVGSVPALRRKFAHA